MRTFTVLAVALLGCALAGCRRDAPAVPADDTADTMPAVEGRAPTAAGSPRQSIAEPVLPPAPMPEGTEVTYRCEDGNELVVSYTHATVVLRWLDGREIKLSRTGSASRSGGDVYAAGTVSLQRDAGSIQLHDGNAPVARCREFSATA